MAAALMFPGKSLPAQGTTQPVPIALNLVVVEGEGAVHNIHQHTPHDPVVRVEDENHRPIAGAAVVFTLPTEGATGEFSNGSKTVAVMTDHQGIAKPQAFKLRQANGKLPIHVTASYRGLSARVTITQFVEGAPPGAKGGTSGGGSKKWIAIAAIAGGAAAGGVYYAVSRNSNNSTSTSVPSGPTPIGITPGTGTIAPPH